MAAVDTLLLEDTRRLARALAQRAVEGQSLFSCATDPMRANAVAEHLVNVWKVAHDIVTARGGQFVAILQPAAYIGKPRVDHITEDLDSRGALGDQFRAVCSISSQSAARFRAPRLPALPFRLVAALMARESDV